jgi:NADH dehydrogenase
MLMQGETDMTGVPRVVVVGGGFGGLEVVKALHSAKVQITIIDRANHFIFQPLLYQVATAGLSPADISMPIRSIFHKTKNVDVLMAEVTHIDTEKREVIHSKGKLAYDFLIVATGATHSYFGKSEWSQFAPGLKSLEDAVHIRRKILLAFEHAEMETSQEKQRAWMNFIVIGGGPAGVELAGAIAELARRVLARDFTHVDPQKARVILIEAGPRILTTFPEKLAARAQRDLIRLGAEVMVNSKVVDVNQAGVELEDGQRIASSTVLWAAGVQASNAHQWLPSEGDRSGRVKVQPDLTLSSDKDVFVIGDTSHCADTSGASLPGVAQVAMQQGRYVAKLIRTRLANQPSPQPFRYVDKGTMATIGRSSAIFHSGRIQFGGWFAWMGWLLLHIMYLIGFRNRILVLIQWTWAYLTWERGARLITPIETTEDISRCDQ